MRPNSLLHPFLRDEYFPKALEDSLARLDRSRIDLIQHHFPSRRVSIPKLMHLMADAVEAGKVRAVGVSNYSAAEMRLAHAELAKRGIPLASNQVQYSLLYRKPEVDGVLDACRELGITLIAYSPLAMGALTGKYSAKTRATGFRRFLPSFRGKAIEVRAAGGGAAAGDWRTLFEEPQPGRSPLADRKRAGASHPRREKQPAGGRECRRPNIHLIPRRGRGA